MSWYHGPSMNVFINVCMHPCMYVCMYACIQVRTYVSTQAGARLTLVPVTVFISTTAIWTTSLILPSSSSLKKTICEKKHKTKQPKCEKRQRTKQEICEKNPIRPQVIAVPFRRTTSAPHIQFQNSKPSVHRSLFETALRAIQNGVARKLKTALQEHSNLRNRLEMQNGGGLVLGIAVPAGQLVYELSCNTR